MLVLVLVLVTHRVRLRARHCCVILAAACCSACYLPRWPVAGTMTSPYGVRVRGWWFDWHPGVDVAAPVGTPVRAVKNGVVRFAGVQSGYGNVIYLDHGGGTISLYAHLSAIDVKNGERVRHGDVIGKVGQTGSATGPHLHLELWRGGRAEDPVLLLGGFPPKQR